MLAPTRRSFVATPTRPGSRAGDETLSGARIGWRALGGLLGLAVVASFAGCGGGGGGGGGTGSEFTEQTNNDGGTFFVDPNQGGGAIRLRLVETLWGRLVDIYDVDEDGEVSREPVFRDFVISENVQSDAVNYELETNVITQTTRLIIKRVNTEAGRAADAAAGRATFLDLLQRASRGLSPVKPGNDDGSSPGPFSLVARNSCLMLRFDDCLNDTPAAERELLETVKVLVGYPPVQPFITRILFDRNHGAMVRGEFHSTRIIVDLTVSESEAGSLPYFLPVRAQGLPSSLPGNVEPNVVVRIPSKIHVQSGQTQILRGLSGAALATSNNGPVDMQKPTQEIVRAFRAGGGGDANNGFLLDLNAPEIVGEWPVSLENVRDDPGLGAGDPVGFDFLVDVVFTSVCGDGIQEADIIDLGGTFYEVLEATPAPIAGRIPDVPVRSTAVDPVPKQEVLGAGTLLTTFNPISPVDKACWVTFAPQAALPPATSVAPDTQLIVRFSEPMERTSVDPFETFMLLRGDSGFPTIEAEKIVVGKVVPSPDLKTFTYAPVLPFAHADGAFEPMNMRLGEVTDLAGNPLRNTLPPVDFSLDPSASAENNSSVVMRFSDNDELAPTDLELGVFDDIRGQIFYDFDKGTIRPRAAAFGSHPVDRTNPVPSIMIPWPQGVQTPLSPLGSKTQTLWRYCDLGWTIGDETKYNMDVYRLHWSPIGGRVIRDFFEEFEIRLSHSRFLPDEDITTFLLPKYPNSGLDGDNEFTDNILDDPLSPQVVTHPRERGYRIEPVDLGATSTGTPIIPFPMNTGSEPPRTFTWRDTAVQGRAGPSGAGVPLDIEGGAPLNIVTSGQVGDFWRPNRVPTVGLPLLMEFRCYPSQEGLGFNPLDISLAINSSAFPSFRAYSTGGRNSEGVERLVDPDLAVSPRGGYHAIGGSRLRSEDNTFYIGQLDTVIRVSRAFTVWIDTRFAAPSFLEPVVVPESSEQPLGTRVIIDYRGATGFDPEAGARPFESGNLDAYGFLIDIEVKPPANIPVEYVTMDSEWRASIAEIDGARYFQMRFSFINNIDSLLNPVLSAVGVAYLAQ